MSNVTIGKVCLGFVVGRHRLVVGNHFCGSDAGYYRHHCDRSEYYGNFSPALLANLGSFPLLFCLARGGNPFLLRALLCGKTFLFRTSLRFSFQLVSLRQTISTQLVGITPAGNFGQLLCRLPQGVRSFLRHNVDRPVIDGFLAADFRLLQTLLAQLISVTVVRYRGELLRHLLVIRLTPRRVHALAGSGVKLAEPCFLVPLPDVGDIALQCVAKRLISEPHDFAIVVLVIKRLLTICEVIDLSHPQIRHQLAQIRLSALRVEVKHLFAVLIGTVPVAVLQEDESSLQQGRGIGGSLLHYHRFADGGLVSFRQLLDAAEQILHKS